MQKSSDSRELICCYTWVLKIANEEVSEPNLFVHIGRFQPAARRLPRSQLAGCCLVGRAGRTSGRDAAQTETTTTTVRYALAHPSVFPYAVETTIIVWMDVGVTAR